MHPSVRVSLITLGYRTSGYPAEDGTPVDLCYLDDEKQPQGYFKAQNEAFLQVTAVVFPPVFLLKLPPSSNPLLPCSSYIQANMAVPRGAYHGVVFMQEQPPRAPTHLFDKSQTIKSPSWPSIDLVRRCFFPRNQPGAPYQDPRGSYHVRQRGSPVDRSGL